MDIKKLFLMVGAISAFIHIHYVNRETSAGFDQVLLLNAVWVGPAVALYLLTWVLSQLTKVEDIDTYVERHPRWGLIVSFAGAMAGGFVLAAILYFPITAIF